MRLISHFDYRQRGWETENMTESQKQRDKETGSGHGPGRLRVSLSMFKIVHVAQ